MQTYRLPTAGGDLYADEGHGLLKLANRLDAYPRAAAFLEHVVA